MAATRSVFTIEPVGPLGQALLVWMKRRHATPTHILKHGGVSRTTIKNLLDGTTRRSDLETLKNIATACGHEWWPPYEFDDQIAASCYRDLYRAAGYDNVMTDTPDTFAEMGLQSLVGTESRARAWRRLIERNRHLKADEIERLDAARDADEETGLSIE